MSLSRIKTPEQLKTCKPGELGKLLGLDRVPEAKCLRAKIGQIVEQRKAQALTTLLLGNGFAMNVRHIFIVMVMLEFTMGIRHT